MTTMTKKRTRLQRWTAMAEDAGLHLEFQHYRRWDWVDGDGRVRQHTATADQVAKRDHMNYTLNPHGGHTVAYVRRAGRDGEVLSTATFRFEKQKQTYYFPSGRKAEFYVPRNYDKRIGRAAAGGMALKKYFEAHPRG